MKKINVTAHTGCMGTEDNSMESLKAAVEAGADTVEFDLRFINGTNKPVMTHNTPATEKNPSVEDAFEYLKDKNITVNIDVKETTDLAAVYKMWQEKGMGDRCFFTGVGRDFVPAVKEQCPGAVYYLNYNATPYSKYSEKRCADIVKLIKECGAVGLNSNFLCLSSRLVNAVQAAGLLVSGWTANDEKAAKRLIKLGVDNITSRKPDMVKKLLK